MSPPPVRASLRRAPAACRGKQAAGTVLAFDGGGQRGRNLGDLCVRAAHGPHAAALADAIKFSDRLVKAFPERFGAAAAGAGLQLVRWLGATAGRGPLKPVLVRGFTRGRALLSGGGQLGEAGAEPGVGRREHMPAQRFAPRLTRFLESLL